MSVDERGRFVIALSGGESPSEVHRALAAPPFSERMPWGATHVFWSDERLVQPDHPESNAGKARLILLDRVPVPETNIHAVRYGLSPEEAAEAYERELADVFFLEGAPAGTFPEFDCLMLGLGGDGHIASLFPGNPALGERLRWVVPEEKGGAVGTGLRVSMTLPLIDRARRVAFVVRGEWKRSVLHRFLSGRGADESFPASMVNPMGECVLFTDIDPENESENERG
jgi:6-phosphogluconolactonase